MRNLLFTIPLCTLMACSGSQTESNKDVLESSPVEQTELKVIQVSSENILADSPYLTHNHKGTPILCWVEGMENTILKWVEIGNSNSTIHEVDVTLGLNTHHESMPKIGFKNNGEIVVLFSKKNPTPENQYAGSIYFTKSTDEGENWSEPKQLHQDTSAGIGRSFYDLATLPNGELGAIWLDGRKKQNGSTLFFSKTDGNDNFSKEIEIAQTTCQCCRTDLFVDQSNNTHIVFRDIIQDSIRDFAISTSSDGGNTFSSSKIISNDRWVVNGCPHTGASIAQDPSKKGSLQIAWYTQGGKPGVYHTSSSDFGQSFEERSFFSESARHPQILGLNNGNLITVWDETIFYNEEPRNRIGIHIKNSKGEEFQEFITPENVEAHHPVITSIDDSRIIIAWSQGRQDSSSIQYVIINTDALLQKA